MKRLGKFKSVVAIALLGVIATLWSARDPGPRVEGRSVREWMLSRIDDDEKQAVLRSLGNSAVPPLLAMLDEQPGLDERGLDWFRRAQPVFHPRVIPAGYVNFAGAHGLVLLSDPATNALPALRERFNRTDYDDRRRYHCAYALARLGPEGIAFLESRVEDSTANQTIRLAACFDFKNYEPETGVGLVMRLARRLGPDRWRVFLVAMHQIEETHLSEYRSRFEALSESGSTEERDIARDALKWL